MTKYPSTITMGFVKKFVYRTYKISCHIFEVDGLKKACT